MQDEEVTLANACADLLSMKKNEAFPTRLLTTKLPGEWIDVRESCLQVGVNAVDLRPGLFATWLADPKADNGYAMILFYDDDSKWSMAAQYNRERLFSTGTSKRGQTAARA